MKIIGRSNDGGFFVEMNEAEMKEFQLLAAALDGNLPYIDPRAYNSGSFEYDFTGTFGVIRAFREANFRFNDLYALLMSMKNTVLQND